MNDRRPGPSFSFNAEPCEVESRAGQQRRFTNPKKQSAPSQKRGLYIRPLHVSGVDGPVAFSAEGKNWEERERDDICGGA